jgi:hypothetical protein
MRIATLLLAVFTLLTSLSMEAQSTPTNAAKPSKQYVGDYVPRPAKPLPRVAQNQQRSIAPNCAGFEACSNDWGDMGTGGGPSTLGSTCSCKRRCDTTKHGCQLTNDPWETCKANPAPKKCETCVKDCGA